MIAAYSSGLQSARAIEIATMGPTLTRKHTTVILHPPRLESQPIWFRASLSLNHLSAMIRSVQSERWTGHGVLLIAHLLVTKVAHHVALDFIHGVLVPRFICDVHLLVSRESGAAA